jgi:hypothetical protein
MIPQPHTLITSIATTISPWAVTNGGVVEVASSPEHAIEILKTSPTKFRLIFLWPGYGSHPQSDLGMGMDQLECILQFAKGLHVNPAQAQMIARPGSTAPQVALIDDVRQIICALRMPQESGCDPRGYTLINTQWLVIDHIDTDQHQLTFQIERALPALDAPIPVTLT